MAAVAVAGVASAQVTMTGKLGFGVRDSSNSAKEVVKTDGGFTISGSEDLGGGMSASASLTYTGGDHSAGVNTDGSSLSLSGGFGTIQWATASSDNDRLGVGSGLLLSGNTAFAATTDGGGASSVAMINYTLPTLVDGLTATVRINNGTTANTIALTNEDAQLRLAFSAGAFRITYNTAGGAAPATDMGVTYDAGIAKFAYAADVTRYAATAATPGKRTEFSVSIPMGAMTLAASMGSQSASSDATKKKASANEFNVSYALSKRTTINAAYASVTNTAGTAKKANTVKVVHTF